jgi:hypothetical protein
MPKMQTLAIICVVICSYITWSQTTMAPSESEKLARLAQTANNTDARPDIEELANKIGPRLTGSAGADRAEHYVLERMRAIGLTDVHSEGWALARSWQRGPATARLVEPFLLPIPIAAYGWTGSVSQQTNSRAGRYG